MASTIRTWIGPAPRGSISRSSRSSSCCREWTGVRPRQFPDRRPPRRPCRGRGHRRGRHPPRAHERRRHRLAPRVGAASLQRPARRRCARRGVDRLDVVARRRRLRRDRRASLAQDVVDLRARDRDLPAQSEGLRLHDRGVPAVHARRRGVVRHPGGRALGDHGVDPDRRIRRDRTRRGTRASMAAHERRHAGPPRSRRRRPADAGRSADGDAGLADGARGDSTSDGRSRGTCRP